MVSSYKNNFPVDYTEDVSTVSPSQLNQSQKLAYDLVINWLDDNLRRAAADPSCEFSQLLLQIDGKAGCGKSFFVKCLI